MMIALAVSAQAASVPSTMNVLLTVNGACAVSNTAMDFGATASDAVLGQTTTATITVNCTNNLSYMVALDDGDNFCGATRNLNDGLGNLISYSIDHPSAGEWGDGVVLGTVYNSVGTGANQNIAADGTITHVGPVFSGNYTDVVNITVTFVYNF